MFNPKDNKPNIFFMKVHAISFVFFRGQLLACHVASKCKQLDEQQLALLEDPFGVFFVSQNGMGFWVSFGETTLEINEEQRWWVSKTRFFEY